VSAAQLAREIEGLLNDPIARHALAAAALQTAKDATPAGLAEKLLSTLSRER
jgi:hypothetical protein